MRAVKLKCPLSTVRHAFRSEWPFITKYRSPAATRGNVACSSADDIKLPNIHRRTAARLSNIYIPISLEIAVLSLQLCVCCNQRTAVTAAAVTSCCTILAQTLGNPHPSPRFHVIKQRRQAAPAAAELLQPMSLPAAAVMCRVPCAAIVSQIMLTIT